jgi:IS30 family transposase
VQESAAERREESKPSPTLKNIVLSGIVLAMFKKDLSPEQLAGRLPLLYPADPEIQVSTETIYQYVYHELEKDPLA